MLTNANNLTHNSIVRLNYRTRDWRPGTTGTFAAMRLSFVWLFLCIAESAYGRAAWGTLCVRQLGCLVRQPAQSARPNWRWSEQV